MSGTGRDAAARGRYTTDLSYKEFEQVRRHGPPAQRALPKHGEPRETALPSAWNRALIHPIQMLR